MSDRGESTELRRLDAGDPMAVARMMRESMGPFGPDQAARSLITTVWRMLPEGERALGEYVEDGRAFGFDEGG